MALSLTEWVLAVICASLVGLAKGGLMMVGSLAVPVLALVMPPVQAAALLLPVYIASDMGGLIAYRKAWDRRVLATLLPGAVVGIALGWATAHLVSDRIIGLIIGLIGAVYAVRILARARPGGASAPRLGAGSFWGVIAGYTSFVSHNGAAPYQIYVQPLGLPAIAYAGTTTVFFAIVNIVKLVPYAALGQFSAANLQIAAILCLPALVSVWIGVRIVRVLPTHIFYAFITWALLLVSLKLIWSGLF
ncbi:MAG: sulfite exporter TauE/SafE family protein [Paracoccus sp. (in: a-proteobacteria)]|nr:sulfite exporter TauE/SafE family protein [Paracoccus sp. (in: a-proteobacteria)]